MPLSRVLSGVLSRLVPCMAVTALVAGSVSPASAQEMQYAQDTPAPDDLLWAHPQARSADPDNGVSATVTGQSSVTASPGDTLEFTVEVTNTSGADLSGLELRAQHADPVTAPGGVATSLLANQGEYPWVGDFVPVDGTVGAGQTRTLTVTVPVGEPGAPADGTTDGMSGTGDAVTLPGLGVTGAGVTPLLFNFNGTSADAGPAYLAGARTTLTVTDAATDADGTDDGDATGTGRTPGLTVLWPLSSTSTVVPGQVGDAPDPAELYLPDETLAAELSAGGRLRGLLDTWRDHVAAPGGDRVRTATCLAVDPDLLETVDRMADGYKVAPAVPSPVQEPTRLRDRWTHRDAGPDAVDGTGADAAGTWLTDLKDAVTDACVVPLPFAGTDVNAVAAGGDPWLAEGLGQRGEQTVTDILGVTPAGGVQVPGSGYLDAGTLPLLRDAATAAGTDVPTTAVVADTTVVTATGTEETDDPGTTGRRVLNTVDGTDGAVRTLQFPADLGAALAATGENPETAAYTSPASRRHLADDGAASRMAAATGVLDLELDAARTGTGAVLAVPPAAWSVGPADAATFLDAVAGHLTDGTADPVALHTALARPAGTGTLTAGTGDAPTAGGPAAADPAPVDDGEARNVAQTAGHLRNLTAIMDDVPNIALTRRVFTRPMFDDLLRSLSDTGRRVETDADRVRATAADRVDRVAGLAYALRNAVTLLPPGNVFTRTSDSSPLIVVARNGLPLPVSVRVNYTAAPGVTLNTPGVQRIPAQGSVTLQMTSAIPDSTTPSDLTMYLSTPDDLRISEDVEIRVAAAPGIGWPTAAVVVGALVLVFLAGRTLRKRRRAAHGSPRHTGLQDDGARD